MNRRELIKRIGQCVGGLAALAVGVKAAESRPRVFPGSVFADTRVPAMGQRFVPDLSRPIPYDYRNIPSPLTRDLPHEWRGFDLYVQNAEGDH